MPSRKDPTSKRLFELFKNVRMITSAKIFNAMFSPSGLTLDDLLFLDKAIGSNTFMSALILNQDKDEDALMIRAFEAAGLDHRNPLDWRHLLSLFAEAHFGDKKTKPKTWDTLALCDVLHDYLEVKKSYPEEDSDLKLCGFLRTDKRYKAKYGDYNLHALRKIVRQARSPKHNVLLRHIEMGNPVLQLVRHIFESRGITWDDRIEGLAKLIAKYYLEVVQVEEDKDASLGEDKGAAKPRTS